jgi:protein-tyrosine phosphatase
VDDGSASMEESLRMLAELSRQGVDTVIATPHFYANDESVADFLERRDNAHTALCHAAKESGVRILKGAEVRYYPGISRMAELEALRPEGTRLLLLEMPMSTWTEYTVKEIIELSSSKNTRVILAHVERYLKLQKPSVWERLYENGVLMQVNASFFTGFTKRKALKLLRDGGIHFIGSDCHNMSTRPPRLGATFELIRSKFGNDFLDQIDEYGKSALARR